MTKVESFSNVTRALLEFSFVEEPEYPITEQGYQFTLTKVEECGQLSRPSVVWQRFLGITEMKKHKGLYHDDTIIDLFNQVGILLGARVLGDSLSISVYSYDLTEEMKISPLFELMEGIFGEAVSKAVERYTKKMQAITSIFNELVKTDGRELHANVQEELWEKATSIYNQLENEL